MNFFHLFEDGTLVESVYDDDDNIMQHTTASSYAANATDTTQFITHASPKANAEGHTSNCVLSGWFFFFF